MYFSHIYHCLMDFDITGFAASDTAITFDVPMDQSW
jgi:hypothetical protein